MYSAGDAAHIVPLVSGLWPWPMSGDAARNALRSGAVNLRSDVVGSLLRPDYLLDARAQLERGELTPAEFKRIEDRAVDEAVALQEAAGLDVVTDGEMRRYAFFGHLVDALEGFDKFGGWAITFRDGEGHEAALQRPVVVEQAAVAAADERRGVHLPARPHARRRSR